SKIKIILCSDSRSLPLRSQGSCPHARGITGSILACNNATPDAAALTRLDALRLAAQPAFWADFEAHREARLTSLEEEIAPLFAQGQQLALFCMGTDIAAFSQAFPRLRLRRGRRPPPGAPGILLNERVYQAALKQPTARALEIGGALTLNSQTRAGYQRARRLEIYGTFEFEGLDEAQITQAYHLIDLDSFRHLYGLSGAASAAEMDALRRAHGLHDLGAAEAEAALFGDAAPLAAPPPPPTVVEAARAGNASALIAGRGEDEAPPDPVIHAAVRLQPGADVAASRQALEAGLQAAGFDVHVVDWRAATGLIGQTVVLIRALLTALSLILAVFILVVVNHSVSLATFERQREIGTLRAIGAGRRFTLGLILTEGLLLSLAGGLIGGGLGALIVAALGAWGLPAPNAFMTFLFSGAALYPRLHLADVAWAVGYVGLITLLSHVAPARMAAGVPPIVAMRGGR
ncbi:FtsX-like permease family protein, partial [Myxococcota bacterium]|nr:FtsX-like permease family protein [Myxococcota bacterium]